MSEVKRTEPEKLVLERGNEETRERLLAGVLPEEDLDTQVRDILFESIAEWPRWRKISKSAIARKCGCSPEEVEFDKVTADSFTKEEWYRLKKLRLLFPDDTVEPFWVVASTKEGCQRKYTKASVRIVFGGRDYVREVVL